FVGGSQISSIDFALELSRRGHDVVVAARGGPLAARLASGGVENVPLPPRRQRLKRLSAIDRVIAGFGPDLVHATEVRAILDLCLVTPRRRTPFLGSIFSTRVPWYLPERVPLTVAMPQLYEFTKTWRQSQLELIEAPMRWPDREDSNSERLNKAIDAFDGYDHLIVLVSRLVEPFKREGILRTIAAVRSLSDRGFRLVIVGDGSARGLYEEAAEHANEATGKRIVSFTGELVDPGPAVEAADVVVGSGTSAIHAAGGEKPTVVVGRDGFSEVVNDATLDDLIHRGFYGVGRTGIHDLSEQIVEALSQGDGPDLRVVASRIRNRYEVQHVTTRLETAMERAATVPPPEIPEVLRAAGRFVHYRLRRDVYRFHAKRSGLVAEESDNYVFGSLRRLAVPPRSRWTGRSTQV
ncbi:MAG: glycosyltransferase, partial [Acidimicrobiia bacterium]